MDLSEALSSESDENHHSNNSNSDGRETVNTESTKGKTKNIKKHYEPFMQGGKVYKFEDNPSEYKKMRKKVQNRESAARVRGRKKNNFEHLEEEVQYLRKNNMSLQLQNARLETENRNLKGQLEYVKSLVRPSKINDPVECYLSDDVLTHPSHHNSSPSNSSHEEDSLMFEEFSPFRTDSGSSGSGWPFLAIFTIILAVFVVPSGTGVSNVAAAFQTQGETQAQSLSSFGLLLECGKLLLKYTLVLGYIWLIFTKVNAYLRNRKLKST